MASYDLVIKGGTVVDGTRLPRVVTDVGISHGRVTKIGRIDPADGQRVLDATGLVVAPGFVDLHCHYDAQIHWDPYCTVSGWHGEYTSPGACWFGVGNLPTNMLDRSRVALRNYAEGMRFSTYPAFGPAGPALFSAAGWQDAFSA